MKKISINTVNNLFDEIEFYESIGFHKIADEVTEQLIKYSASFQEATENLNKSNPYLSNILKAKSLDNYVAWVKNFYGRIPECYEYLKALLNTNNKVIEFLSNEDRLISLQDQWKKNNPEKQLDSAALEEIFQRYLSQVSAENLINQGNIANVNPLIFQQCQNAIASQNPISSQSDDQSIKKFIV